MSNTIPIFFVALLFLLAGWVLGVVAMFAIRGSRGRLRGTGVAALSVILSTAALFGIFIVMVAVPGRPHKLVGPERLGPGEGATPSPDYRALVSEPPPQAWFESGAMPRRIPGPAAVGTMNMPAQDADEMLRIIDRSSLQDVDVRHIVEMTLWKLRERGTGIAIVAWIAELDTKEDPRGWNSTDTDGDFLLTRGSFRIGVFCEKRRRSPTVDRLGEHYKDRLNDILARNY